MLKSAGRLLVNATLVHSYPHCWRSDKPLIYRAVPSWFVRVEQLRDELVVNNAKSYWVPSFVQEKRFHQWLAEARDWCVSRNRYWGTPLPLWKSDDYSQLICIGSIAELERYAGHPLTDLHRHHVDAIRIPDPRGPNYPPLTRVEEVFDCWFESGSMPYAQVHYPFENADRFPPLASQGNVECHLGKNVDKDASRESVIPSTFPADFVAEGLDQTRGWFYTLMVLSTALFKKPPFKNLIVNGLVLAADGKKMSKRLKNYPDPHAILDAHGADALRLYLINSPVVRAESLRFREEGVREVVRDVLLPWYHALRFFVQEATRFETGTGCGARFSGDPELVCSAAATQKLPNLMDRWICCSIQSLVAFVRGEMTAYRLYTVVPALVRFLGDLTNWFVRLNRERMRGVNGVEDTRTALEVFYSVLFTMVRLMAPFTPFMAELMYQNLRNGMPESHSLHRDSVHFLMMPEIKDSGVIEAQEADERLRSGVRTMQEVIVCGRTLRERSKLALKTPLKELAITCHSEREKSDLLPLVPLIRDELNLLEVTVSADPCAVQVSALPNFKALGTRVGPEMPQLARAIKALSAEEISAFESGKPLTLLNIQLEKDDILIKRQPSANAAKSGARVEVVGSLLLALDTTLDESLQQMATAREIANRVQKLRKQAKLSQDDNNVRMFVSFQGPSLREAFEKQASYVERCLRRPLRLYETLEKEAQMAVFCRETFDINGEALEVCFIR